MSKNYALEKHMVFVTVNYNRV